MHWTKKWIYIKFAQGKSIFSSSDANNGWNLFKQMNLMVEELNHNVMYTFLKTGCEKKSKGVAC